MDEREHQSRGSGCLFVGIVLGALLVMYVLSVGPAAWVVENYPGTKPWLETIYTPIGIVTQSWEPLADLVGIYMSWWTGKRI